LFTESSQEFLIQRLASDDHQSLPLETERHLLQSPHNWILEADAKQWLQPSLFQLQYFISYTLSVMITLNCLIIMVTLIYVLNYVLVALTKVLAFQTDFRIITITAYVDRDLTCIVKHESSAL